MGSYYDRLDVVSYDFVCEKENFFEVESFSRLLSARSVGTYVLFVINLGTLVLPISSR